MKIKMQTLFEQGATFDRLYEKPGENPTWVANPCNYLPSSNDDYVYVHLYRVGGDVILHTVSFSKRDKGFAGFDRKEILEEGVYDYISIRTAIARFDALLDEFLNSPVTKPVERIYIHF